MKKAKIVVVIAIIISIFGTITSNHICFADTPSIYESENNNEMANADITYDNYNSYGAITSQTPDWWKFTATTTGFANIWLGNIPNPINYDIYLYSSNGAYMACSVQTLTTQEIIKCRVNSGATYYIKITCPSGYTSTSNYKLRIKTYDLGIARMFVYNLPNYESVSCAAPSFNYLYSSGYEGQWYTNNSVNAAFGVLPTSRIFVVRNHANAGLIRFDTPTNQTRLFANNNSSMTSVDRALENIGSLSDVGLLIFGGCSTGNTSSYYGNLVDMAISKGAYCSIGWKVNIINGYADEWTKNFFYYCSLNRSVESAASSADSEIFQLNPSAYSEIQQRYVGNSRPGAIVI